MNSERITAGPVTESKNGAPENSGLYDIHKFLRWFGGINV